MAFSAFSAHEITDIVQELSDWGPDIERSFGHSGIALAAFRAGIKQFNGTIVLQGAEEADQQTTLIRFDQSQAQVMQYSNCAVEELNVIMGAFRAEILQNQAGIVQSGGPQG